MKLIVGLGNPGPTYAGTRHNVGFEVVDLVASRAGIDLAREKFHAWFGDGWIGEQRTALMKPTTFMNRSGQAVAAAVQFYGLGREDLLVVCDDTALPLGHARVRARGSSGHHNGLQDVMDRMGSGEIARLRLGIGRGPGNGADYVLSRFAPGERREAEAMLQLGAEVAEHWAGRGTLSAMNRYNRRLETGGPERDER